MYYNVLSQYLSIYIILISMSVLYACDDQLDSSGSENEDATETSMLGEDMGMSAMAGMSEMNPMTSDMTPSIVDMQAAADMMVEVDATLPLFEGELVKCSKNEGIESLRPILSGGRVHPNGRGEQAAAYDP